MGRSAAKQGDRVTAVDTHLVQQPALPSPTVNPFLDVAPFNTSVMFELINARALGLSAAQPIFRYHIETRARDRANFAQVVDRVPASGTLEYNIVAAAVAPINSTRGVPNLQQRPLFIVSPPGTPSSWTFRIAGFGGEVVLETLDEALASALRTRISS